MSIKVDPDWWKTIFDEVYLLTDSRSVCDEEITRRETDLICQLVPIRPGDAVLDLCGGHGRHSLELAGRGFSNCTVLDYSPFLTRHAQALAAQRGLDLRVVNGDARKTGLASESFDHVLILGNSLGYLPDPGADGAILEEAGRLLRPGGWLLVDTVDGGAVRDGFRPRAWHEIGDILVCREREIRGSSVAVRELVVSKRSGLLRDQSYSIRFYEAETLAPILLRAGFEQIATIRNFSPFAAGGDYGFMSSRMISTARKP